MVDVVNTDIEKLLKSITGLEAQRAILGDEVVDPALESLREKLVSLEAQLVAAAPPTPAEERRLITVLFSDVVGSTAMAESLDPEQWRGIVARLHETAGEIIHQHQGQVAQYLGDGLLAFFGAQAASETDPENAIRAALVIHQAVSEAFGPLPGTSGETIQLRVGIHSGLVVVGDLGDEIHKEFTATGDAMNLAARLQSSAPPGGVLISQDTYRYVRGVFDFTPQPPLQVKGKREPLRTYLVRRVRPRPFRVVTRGVAGIETRTVGREAEMEQIRSAYLEAYEQGKVVWVQMVGEPGVGKSRLVEDTREWLDLRPELIRLLKARAYEGDRYEPFALVRRMWFDRFQIAEDAPLALAEAKWVKGFQELMGKDEEEPAHALGSLVGLPFENSPYIKGMRENPVQIKGRAFVVSRELLGTLREETPVEILLEDLHNADTSSWEYLTEVFLTGEQKDNALFVLASARPEWQKPEALAMLAQVDTVTSEVTLATGIERFPVDQAFTSYAPHPENAHYLQIDLEPLSDSATSELIEELLRDVEGVPDMVIKMIVERAEGNPYYAEELVNWFIDQGIIDRKGEPWCFLAGRWRTTPLPATLQHLLLTRLSSLSDAERFCLQCGAIFGRDFWEGGLGAIGIRGNGELLAHLRDQGFVVRQPESNFESEEEWSFRQNLLQEVVYESILKRERSRMHKLAGDWLEAQARNTGRLEEFAGLLGVQAERAGEVSEAADWYIRAGERARTQGGLKEASRYFERALELLPPVEKERRWRAIFGHVVVLHNLGEPEALQATIATLLELAHEFDDDDRLAEAYYWQGFSLRSLSEYRKALNGYNEALGAVRRSGNQRIEALALSDMAFIQYRLNELKTAARTAKKALELVDVLDDDATRARVLFNLANYFTESGDYERGIQLRHQEIGLWHYLGNHALESSALMGLGYGYVILGQHKLAYSALERSLKINEDIGARRVHAYVLQNLGLLYFRTGDGHAARQVLKKSINEMEAVSDPLGRQISMYYLGLVQEGAGDVAGAERRFAKAYEVLYELGMTGFTQDTLIGLARCSLAQGRLEEANEQITEVWNYLKENGTSGLEFPVWTYLTCADIFDALGEKEKSRAAVEEGYNELQIRVEKLSNPDWRRAYAENIPEHLQIVAWWERLQD